MHKLLQLGMGWFAEEPGGLNRMYAGLFGGLTGCGTAVTGLCAGDLRVARPPADIGFFERREASAVRRLTACRRSVRAALKTQQIDTVAAHFALYALPVLDLLRTRRFVVHFHGPWADESQAEREGGVAVALKRRIESAVYRRADRCIALSQAFASILVQRYGVAPARIVVVPGGVDATRYSIDLSPAQARERLALPQDRPLVVAVRRLVHRVGLERLIEAMSLVRRQVPEALLLIAGGGPLAETFGRRLEEMGLREHVRLLGYVPDDALPTLYRACNVSIVPSVALEGFGLTTIESLAAGTPVLVTPVGGLPETVAGLDPSLVLPDAAPASIADALIHSLDGRKKLPSSQRCADYVRHNFDWPVIARKVLAAYG